MAEIAVLIVLALLMFVLGWCACLLWQIDKTLKKMRNKLPK